MKKLLSLMLAAMMLASLSACGNKEKKQPESSSNKDTSQTVQKNADAVGEEEIIDDDANIDDAAFDYTEDYIDDHLKGDYSITYKMTSSDTGEDDSDLLIKIMRSDEGYFAMMGEETQMLFIKNGEKFDMYTGDIENGFEKVPGVSYDENQVKAQTQTFLGYMSAYSEWSDLLEKNGSITIAGRNCERYSYEFNMFGTKAKSEYCIDKETGVCMKYFVEGRSGGEGGSYQFECTEFITSGVALPAYN